MKELSRKIDEKKSPGPVPPIILNMQAGAGQPAHRPIQMDLPSSGPQPEGFPRYASSDMEEQDEQVMDSSAEMLPEEAAPQGPQQDSGRSETRAPREEPEVSLEEVPEDLEPLTDELASPEEHAPAPAGWPGMTPITDSEPEPEIDMEIEEAPEAELEQLEPVEEKDAGDGGPREEAGRRASEASGEPGHAGTGGTEPPAPGRSVPEGPPRSSDDVRKELRGYLDGVRDRLDKGGGHASPGDLLDYLGKLSDYLPGAGEKAVPREHRAPRDGVAEGAAGRQAEPAEEGRRRLSPVGPASAEADDALARR